MEIQHGSIVDTVVAFAKQHLQTDMSVEDVSAQLRQLPFSVQVELASAIKADDVGEFQAIVNVVPSSDNEEVEESGGTQSSAQVAAGQTRAQLGALKQQARDARTGRGQPDQVAQGGSGAVAGGNKAATGGPQGHSPANKNMNAQDMQRQQNSQQSAANAQQAQANAEEIERLKQLAMGQR